MDHSTNGLLSRDQIAELRAGLLMIDVYKARKHPDKSELGLVAYWEAAKRTGMIATDEPLESFLGRLKAEEFNEVMVATASVVPTQPLPGGLSEPNSSDGTD